MLPEPFVLIGITIVIVLINSGGTAEVNVNADWDVSFNVGW